MIATWMTRDRRRIPVGAMERDHILKSMALIRSGKLKRQLCDGLRREEWLLVFAAELVRRDRVSEA